MAGGRNEGEKEVAGIYLQGCFIPLKMVEYMLNRDENPLEDIMEERLNEILDWPEIEGIVCADCDHPHQVLGAHKVEEQLLIQAFIPHAETVSVKVVSTQKSWPMTKVDEAGFFALLLNRKTKIHYVYEVTYDNGTKREIEDPYAFDLQITESDMKRFEAGIHYEIYDVLGAHPRTVDGVPGTQFAVWAPNAWSVSVVGDFNMWDGRIHQMSRRGDSGIFELFIPGIESGAIYKYEIEFKGGSPALKSDPYGNGSQLRPDTASVVADLERYRWQDAGWIKERKKKKHLEQPMSIYEVHLGSWRVPEDEEQEFYNYREIAPMLTSYVKEMGYTHVELMPVMEHLLDESWGYLVTGYYAPTSRYGTPEDFMYFMDYMHGQGIGVILDWVPAHFPKDTVALADFDGTGLYEHKDPRQGMHPHWGTLIFNYGRPQVSNFLIANALFWVNRFHADGIRMDAVASMLYLDYGKNDGEWVPNIYGGHENLEALELLKHLNSIFKKQENGALLIAEESTAWPRITGDVDDGAVGFDLKWNMGWMNDFLGYMQCDPYFRKHHYNELTFSMVYAYSENFILVFSHDEVVHGKGSMAGKMPGENFETKFANLRAAYGFWMTHPGKKLLFMGQDFAQMDEWNEKSGIQWHLLQYDLHSQMQACVKALHKLYRESPALYRMDHDPDGFEWIDCSSWEESICTFLRKTDKPEETMLVVCNFDTIDHEDFQVGVPMPGKYKEVFNSDAAAFGGSGEVNGRVKVAKKQEWDERPYSISIKLAPLTVAIFRYIPVEEKKVSNKTAKKKKDSAKTAGKAAGAKKKTTKVDQQVEKLKKAAMEPAEETAKKEPEKTAEEIVKKEPEKPAEEAVKKETEKPVADTAKKPVEETVKKASEKPTEKAVKKEN